MYKKIACVALLSLAATLSCSDSDITSINKNPLVAGELAPRQTLVFALLNYSWQKTDWLGWKIGNVTHHFNYANDSPAGGEIATYFNTGVWSFLQRSLANLQALDAYAQKESSHGAHIRVIVKTLSAMVFFDLTCIFGDIPFSEAQNPSKYPYPKFDTQEKVFDGIVALLDEAIALANEASGESSIDLSGDLLLSGDIQRWKAFANSLKIRTLMLIRNVDARKANAEQQLVKAFGEPIIDATVHFAQYTSLEGEKNAYFDLLYRLYGFSNQSNPAYAPSATLNDMLVSTKDPRLKYWIYNPSKYRAGDYGETPKPRTIAVFSDLVIRPGYPDVFMEPGELDFYRAELILGNAMVGSAQDAFEAGIKHALTYWGKDIPGLSFFGISIKDEEIDNYIAEVGTVNLRKVHEQLWLESFLRPVISWNTVRRTGIPELQPLPNAKIPIILKRLPISVNETRTNPNAPTSSPGVDTPMWFEKKK